MLEIDLILAFAQSCQLRNIDTYFCTQVSMI